MDYKIRWDNLKYELLEAIEEGDDCGYNDPKHECYGKYETYKKILEKMNNLESKEV